MSLWVTVTANCVVCPVCAFTFDASHTDSGDDDLSGYTCPCCTEQKTRPIAEAARAVNDPSLRRLQESLRKSGWGEQADKVEALRKVLYTTGVVEGRYF